MKPPRRPKLSQQLSAHLAALGRKGGAARAKKLSPEQRQRIAQKAAQTRWNPKEKNEKEKT
jgi:hypothetical protein